MNGAIMEPVVPRIQICPVLANDDKGMVLGLKKFPVISPLILANGMLDR